MGTARATKAKTANARQEVPTLEFAAAFEHAPVGMAITDEGAVLLHANQALADMLGYTREELVGKSVVDLTHPDDLATSLASNARLGGGDVRHFSLEKRYLHKSGSTVWARVDVSLLTDRGRRHHLLHVADITREKATIEGHREVEQRFREMAESIEQDFWVMRLKPRELLYASPAAARIWGFDTMQNRERPQRIIDLVHPDDREIFNAMFTKGYERPGEGEYRVTRADGAQRWFRTRVFPMRDANGVIDRVAGVTEDITPRKNAEAGLERHRAFDRLVMELSAGFVNLPPERMRDGFEHALSELGQLIGAEVGAIFLLDEKGEKLRTTYMWSAPTAPSNWPLYAEFDFGPDHPLRAALLRDAVLDVSDVAALPDDVADIRDRVLANGLRSFIDVPLYRRGEIIGIYGFGTTSRQTVWSGEVADRLRIAAELFCNAIDRIRAEEEARVHRDALAHALRLGTMGQLASGIAHELNQPLAAILNYAAGCERHVSAGATDSPDFKEAIRRIVEQAVRAANVIKTLRALVRKGEGERTWHDPNELVRTAASFIDAEASGAGIGVFMDLDGELPRAQVDPIQIEQVLLNLLRNAVDAMRGKAITRPEIRIRTRRASPTSIEVHVSDNGPGISAEHKSFIFDEFYTTKASGLGLGLSISRSIVEAHGGRLWLSSSAPIGATFSFTLPTPPSPGGGV